MAKEIKTKDKHKIVTGIVIVKIYDKPKYVTEYILEGSNKVVRHEKDIDIG